MSKQFPGFSFNDDDLKKMQWPAARQAALYLLCHDESPVTPARVCELLRVKRRPCTPEEALKALNFFVANGTGVLLSDNRFVCTPEMETALWKADMAEMSHV